MSQERVSWQEKYAIIPHQHGDGINYESINFTSGSTGIEANKYCLLLNNRPDTYPHYPRRSVPPAHNAPEHADYTYWPSLLSPTFTMTFDATLETLGLFFWLLAQSGVNEGVGPTYTKTCSAYCSSTPVVWASVLRTMAEGSVADSIVSHGCICRSITLTGSEGGVISCTVEMLSRNTSNDFNAGSALLSPSEGTPLLFQNTSFAWSGGSNYYASRFSYTVTNNAVFKHKANGSMLPTEYRLGMMEHTLSVTIPWIGEPAGSRGGNYHQDMLAYGPSWSTTVYLANPPASFVLMTPTGVLDKATTTRDGQIVSMDLMFRGIYFGATIKDSVNRSIA